MAEIINILKRAENVEVSPAQAGYSMVRIHAGTDDNNEEIIYEAGDDTGAVLEISNEFGSQQMAENILAEVAGVKYQPGRADGALVDPAAEIGDVITANNAYFGLYIRATEFGRLMKSNVEAPTDQEIEHEFGAETSQEREYIRFTGQVKSTLKVHSAEIAAKVSIEDRNTETGFGWSLTNNQWRVGKYTGSTLNPVFTVDENGVYIVGSGSFTGTITANGGTIGGLKITNNSIESANGAFKVDAAGNITANSGTFAGSVYAKNIQYGTSGGVDRGYFSGAGLSGGSVGAGKIVANDLTTGQFSGGVIDSLGYADYSWGVFHRNETAPYVEAGGFYGQLYMIYQGAAAYSMSLHTHTFTESGGKITIGGADWTGKAHSFSIADTQAYKDGVSAVYISATSGTSYSNSADRSCNVTGSKVYYTSQMVYGRILATLSNGNQQTIYIGMDASKAYAAGRSSAPAPKYAVFTVQAISASQGGTVYIYSNETGLMRLGVGDTFDQT